MHFLRGRTARWLAVVFLSLAAVCPEVGLLTSASGEQATVRMVPQSTGWPLDGGSFTVTIGVEGVYNLAMYEWTIGFDPNVVQFVGVVNEPFLGSTGRKVRCYGPIEDEDTVNFGCATLDATPAGPNGSGLLSTVTFSPVAKGNSVLSFEKLELGDPLAGNIPAAAMGTCVAIGAPGEHPPACATPTPMPPAPTPTPPPPGTTPLPPTAVATTPAPAGPTATPPALPPDLETVDLAPSCNAITSTYPDETPVVALANAVLPTGILESLWKFDNGFWLGYSPRFPEASDLAKTGFLDVVFVCVSDAGFLVRPVA